MTNGVSEEIRQALCYAGCEKAVVINNPAIDDAIIGVTEDGRVVYDYTLMVESIVLEDGIDQEEAVALIEYNIIRALPYTKENMPVIVYRLEI